MTFVSFSEYEMLTRSALITERMHRYHSRRRDPEPNILEEDILERDRLLREARTEPQQMRFNPDGSWRR